MHGDNGSDKDGASSDGNETERATSGGVAEHANPRVASAEVALYVALEVGEAVAELVEAEERERVFLVVELEEEVVGVVALRLR